MSDGISADMMRQTYIQIAAALNIENKNTDRLVL
jgi:hypothetical protein